MYNRQIETLKEQCLLKPKLWTYCKITNFDEPQTYVNNTKRIELISLSKFKMVLLPLAIETGRYNNIPREEKLCKLCTKNTTENEIHFLLNCDFYDVERKIMLEKFISYDWNHDFIK